MKFTLLELTQTVLRSIKGEQVNSIGDTEESIIAAEIVREAYLNIIANTDLPEHKTLFELNASGDPTKPTLMSLPSDVIGLEWVEYDKATNDYPEPKYTLIGYTALPDFKHMVNQLSTTETNVGSYTVTTGLADSILFKYRNDKAPDFYTSLDDGQLVFDSYDNEVDTTLQKNKTSCYGLKEPAWLQTDLFVPNLDSQQFDLLIQEAKALAWVELRQTQHVKAEQKARRSWVMLDSRKNRTDYNHKLYYYTKLPDYGRKV